jgi:hypothetical protein
MVKLLPMQTFRSRTKTNTTVGLEENKDTACLHMALLTRSNCRSSCHLQKPGLRHGFINAATVHKGTQNFILCVQYHISCWDNLKQLHYSFTGGSTILSGHAPWFLRTLETATLKAPHTLTKSMPLHIILSWKQEDANKMWFKRIKQTPGIKSASELYRPSDRRLSEKLIPTLADRGCRVVCATNPRGR